MTDAGEVESDDWDASGEGIVAPKALRSSFVRRRCHVDSRLFYQRQEFFRSDCKPGLSGFLL